MNQKRKTIMLILIMIVVIVGAYMTYNILSSNYKSNEELDNDRTTVQKAKDFVAYDEEGNTVSPLDYVGKKPVVLNFWASWCPPCKEEMPEFQKMKEAYGDEVEILMVNETDGQRETKESAKAYLESMGYDLKIIYDSDLDGGNTYRVQALPRTIFIDKEGYQIKSHVGVITKEDLEKYIKQMIQ